jgi:hypothetical protein
MHSRSTAEVGDVVRGSRTGSSVDDHAAGRGPARAARGEEAEQACGTHGEPSALCYVKDPSLR